MELPLAKGRRRDSKNAFFNGKEGRDDFRKPSFWLKGDGGFRKMLFLMVKKDGMILEQAPFD